MAMEHTDTQTAGPRADAEKGQGTPSCVDHYYVYFGVCGLIHPLVCK